ncbi:MAG: amidotransferase [Armatimonadetes bacterium]|nr:amidotransferase [Armatimonadota bacterium]
MRVHVLQHVPFEGLGSILAWCQARGATVSFTLFGVSPELPDPDQVDLLVILGGPMSVNDEAELPWLAGEKRFVGEMVRAGRAVLGICLGAQLIASALGSPVYPGPHKEIGWHPVFADAGPAETFAFAAQVEVFHWHGETFDLPTGAVRLAHSAGCANQAFQVGARTIGLQYHLETTPESAEAIITHCADELVPAPYVQSEAELRAAPGSRYAAANALMARVLDYLVR